MGQKQKSQRSTVLGDRCIAAGDWLSALASAKSKEMAELCESGLVWSLYCPSSSADGGPVAFSNAALTSNFLSPLSPFPLSSSPAILLNGRSIEYWI